MAQLSPVPSSTMASTPELKLSTLSANVRGLQTNVGELTHNFILKNNIDFVVTVETFLDASVEPTFGKIPGYCHWIRRDRLGMQGGGIAVCHKENMQVQTLSVQVPRMLEMMFFRIILKDDEALLLCALYRPQWQGDAPISFLTTHLDEIMETHNCQNVLIVGDLNQHLVQQAFDELSVVQGLTNYVNFSTHIRGGSLDPVLSDLPADQCWPLDYVGSSDHKAVLSQVSLTPALVLSFPKHPLFSLRNSF